MKTRYFIAALTTIALASCKQELMPQENSNAQELTAPAAGQQTAQVTPQPQQATAQPQPVAQQTAQAPVQVAKGMNPPHGQPGHRCDIAVGAPLNSKPAAKAMPTATPGTAVATQMNSAALSSKPTAPGMNPPHGQPGHRCDIAVGAPLNSAPTTPAAVPSTIAAPAAAPTPTETKN